MARTPRAFSRGSHPEAKAGENIGQGKPPEDVTEKARRTNHQAEISEVLTDSEFEALCGSALVAALVQRPFSRLRAA